jgi:YHS domain-containing protein
VTRLAVPPLAALLLAGCGAMNVISEGADSNLMLKGYDPVAYFTVGKPVRGSPDIKVEHRGVTYRFANAEHRRIFITSPDRFVPQYGGFCSNGMAYAVPLGGEPEVFKIINGRLHVFGGLRSKLYFEMDQERNLRLADHYWETEVKDSNWRIQSLYRVWLNRVPHYKTNAELAAEYERRFGKKPGAG